MSNDALEALRWRAVDMVRSGASQRATAKALGVHRNTVCLWIKWLRQGGDAALKPKLRGRQWRLSTATEAAIKRLITANLPDQLDLSSALWTRGEVHALMATHFGIAVDYSTTVRYLCRWRLTRQPSIERQDPEIRSWLGQDYPEIAARAKAERAEIHWADVTRISDQPNDYRSFAKQYQIPVAARDAPRQTTSMISTVTTDGRLRFMLHEGALNTASLLTFLERLCRTPAARSS